MEKSIASVAALIASPSRVAMIVELLDGRALPAGELARAAEISAQCASAHLAKLADGGVLRIEREGRHRYYAIANPFVAEILETLAHLIDQTPHRPRRSAKPDAPLRYARTCYDHLAGQLGVSITDAMIERSILIPGEGPGESKTFVIEKTGERWFRDVLDIDVHALKAGRHGIARRCLDWTQRRHHLAGPLGTQFFARGCTLGWFMRSSSSRIVKLTLSGQKALLSKLGPIDVHKAPQSP